MSPEKFAALVRAYGDARAKHALVVDRPRSYDVGLAEAFRLKEEAEKAVLDAHAEVKEENEWLKRRNAWLNSELDALKKDPLEDMSR